METYKIGAVIMAAGLSRRMGQPKLLLPWGETSVIGKVVNVLKEAQVSPIVVVAGGLKKQLSHILHGEPVQIVYNPDYENGEMLRSLQVGLSYLEHHASIDAALIVLGDQPQIEIQVVHTVIGRFGDEQGKIIFPSYQMRRGHPWLVSKKFFTELLLMQSPLTLRDFVKRHTDEIVYVDVNAPSIIQDLDTPEDYARFRPA
jgi:molybdenum cofactor cytidylyltransferase